MSKKSKNIEKKDTKITKAAKAPELSEQELDKVAGAGYTPPKAGQIDKGGKSW
jgi:hypothetical protein